jgi:hypothetical protein
VLNGPEARPLPKARRMEQQHGRVVGITVVGGQTG